MADHVRKQLREAFASTLGALTTTGANVFQSRAYALATAELPGLRIYTVSEDAQAVTMHSPAVVQRDIEVRIEGVAAETADLDDKLDLIAKEVEIALGSAVTVGTKSVPLVYTGCEITVEDGAEKPVGVVALRYQAQLFTAANAPDTLL